MGYKKPSYAKTDADNNFSVNQTAPNFINADYSTTAIVSDAVTPDFAIRKTKVEINTGSLTVNAPTNVVDGNSYVIVLQKSGTTDNFITWNSYYKGSLPSSATEINGTVTMLNFEAYNGALYLVSSNVY